MEIFDEDEYAHRIHFSKNFDCDSDSDKSDFDEWYYKHKPPPIEIHTCDIVKIEPLTAVLYNKTISTVLSEDHGDKLHNIAHGIQERSSPKKIEKKKTENVIVEIQKPISFFDAMNNASLCKVPSSCTEESPENNGIIISKKKHSHQKKKDESKKTKTFELSPIEWPSLGSTYSSMKDRTRKNVNSPLQFNKKKSQGSKEISEKCDHHVCVSSHTKQFLSESINSVIGQFETPLLLGNNKKIESVQENKNGVRADLICPQAMVCDTVLPSYYNEKESTKLRKNGHSETINHKSQSLLRNSCNNSEKGTNGKQLLINQNEIDHKSLSTDILNQFIIANCTQTTKSKKKKSKKSNHPTYEEFNLASFMWPPLTKVTPSSVDSSRENQSCKLSKNDTDKELIQVTQTAYRKSRTFEKESNKKIEKDMCTHEDTMLQNSRKQLKESVILSFNKKETLEEQHIQKLDAKVSMQKGKAGNGKKGDQVKLQNISLFNKEHSLVLLDKNHNNIDSQTSKYNTKLERQSCNVLINPNESICTMLPSLPLKEADLITNVIKRHRRRRRKKNTKSKVFESNTLNTCTLGSEKGSTVGDNSIASVSFDKQTRQQKENNLQFCNTFTLRDVFDKHVQSKCDIKNVINGDKVSTCKSNIDDGTIRGLQPSNIAYKKKEDPLWPKGFLLPSFKKKSTIRNNTKLPSHKDCNKNYDLLPNEKSSQIVYKKQEDLLWTRDLQLCFKTRWKKTQKCFYENVTQSPTFPVSSISSDLILYRDSMDMLDEIAMNCKIPLNGFVTGGKDFFLLDKLFLPSSFSIYARPRLAMCNIFLHYYTGY